ncbi:iron-containing alcohol dehydrogenase [Reticulomyxa filosa]|uniref:Iron-containing alcohol dehydrogenase n=1 Tax=Reticulomyxa filosa TaxID=46433 RepID=X6PCM6_RETFI|nr:iron-containing alcohol dehydrogenase [Reticulomyxa filosa]|eukprot:ETO35941.1 iron-containing alcohol dehydrogenase [Reticulomyxa filosa]
MAGMAFGNSDVGAVHCLSETLGGMFDIPHGMLNASLLVSVLKHHQPRIRSTLHHLFRHLKCEQKMLYQMLAKERGNKFLDSLAKDDLFILFIDRLRSEIKIPAFSSIMQQYGITSQHFKNIAEIAAQNRSNDSNPQIMTADNYMQILENAQKEEIVTKRFENKKVSYVIFFFSTIFGKITFDLSLVKFKTRVFVCSVDCILRKKEKEAVHKNSNRQPLLRGSIQKKKKSMSQTSKEPREKLAQLLRSFQGKNASDQLTNLQLFCDYVSKRGNSNVSMLSSSLDKALLEVIIPDPRSSRAAMRDMISQICIHYFRIQSSSLDKFFKQVMGLTNSKTCEVKMYCWVKFTAFQKKKKFE